MKRLAVVVLVLRYRAGRETGRIDHPHIAHAVQIARECEMAAGFAACDFADEGVIEHLVHGEIRRGLRRRDACDERKQDHPEQKLVHPVNSPMARG